MAQLFMHATSIFWTNLELLEILDEQFFCYQGTDWNNQLTTQKRMQLSGEEAQHPL